MKIKWLGHACFLITNNKGLKVITDPYMIDPRGMIKYGPVKEYADIVTISHNHGDHNYTGDIQGKPEIVQGEGKHTAKGIDFLGVGCYHDKASGRERGANTIFCFTIDDVRVCHFGDLGHLLDSQALNSIGHADVIMFPIGGPMATVELTEAVTIWDQVKPGVVIPMHFRTDKCTFPKYGREDLLKLKPNAIQTGKSDVEFTAGKIPAEQIMILEHAL